MQEYCGYSTVALVLPIAFEKTEGVRGDRQDGATSDKE